MVNEDTMKLVEELLSRIMKAMDRISQHIDSPGIVPVPTEAQEISALLTALDNAKRANAQLSDHLTILTERFQKRSTNPVQGVDSEQVKEIESEMKKLKKTSENLRKLNNDLRKANLAGMSEVGLVDASIRAELASLKAERSADVAEINTIISQMFPLLNFPNPSQPKEGT